MIDKKMLRTVIIKSGPAEIIAGDPSLEAAYLGGEAEPDAARRSAALAS